MTCIEVSELNGRAGNSDYFEKSRQAEAVICESASRLMQRPITCNPTKGKHVCDFETARNLHGDIKIYSRPKISVEISQFRHGRKIPGWFTEYMQLVTFAGLLTLNPWFSEFHQRHVFKLRWLPWPNLIDYVVMHADQIQCNSGGEYIQIDPVMLPHEYMGDFFEVPSKYGATHKAFDTNRFYANNKLNIQKLHKWF